MFMHNSRWREHLLECQDTQQNLPRICAAKLEYTCIIWDSCTEYDKKKRLENMQLILPVLWLEPSEEPTTSLFIMKLNGQNSQKGARL